MIPSDHFVHYYNEVFKALEERGLEHLLKYWDRVGELQKMEVARDFAKANCRPVTTIGLAS